MIDMLCACVSCKISHVEPLFSHTYYMTECLQYLNNRDDFNSHMQLSGQCTHPKCDLKSALNPGALLRKAPVKRRWRQSFGENGRKGWAVRASHAKLTVPQPPLPPFLDLLLPFLGITAVSRQQLTWFSATSENSSDWPAAHPPATSIAKWVFAASENSFEPPSPLLKNPTHLLLSGHYKCLPRRGSTVNAPFWSQHIDIPANWGWIHDVYKLGVFWRIQEILAHNHSHPLLLVQQTNLNKAVFYPLKVCTEEIPANCFKTIKTTKIKCLRQCAMPCQLEAGRADKLMPSTTDHQWPRMLTLVKPPLQPVKWS